MFPGMARLADKFSIVPSFITGDGNHDIKLIVSRGTLRANMARYLFASPARSGPAMP